MFSLLLLLSSSLSSSFCTIAYAHLFLPAAREHPRRPLKAPFFTPPVGLSFHGATPG